MAARPFRRLGLLLVAVVTAALLPVVVSGPSGAAPLPPGGGLFTPLPDFVPSDGPRARVVPRTSAAHRIDLARLADRLALAPSERAVRRGATPVSFSLPDPAGTMVGFRIQGSRVMQPGLAARHPEIRTWAGVGITDPTTTIRLDLTPMGFHASVLSPRGIRAWYVDPASNRRGETTHLSYARSALPAPDRPLVEPDLDALDEALAPAEAAEAPGELVQRRTYRLAFVTDPSYAAYFGTANVLAEKTTLINRVNQVYNDDLAIRMVLVDGSDELNLDTVAVATGPNGPCGANGCYDPADLDPDGGGCTGALLTRNIFVIGQIIGADNYDVGHIGLGINGGGVAGLGVVGEDGKARGCTGLPKPQGDFYAVDYVAHEIGHQFGGNHTFNGTLANCSLTNRNGGTSVEPGSGSSVMAYAGICGRDNLQPHSDPYFSQRSIQEITAHATGAPGTFDEQQVVNLQGYDSTGETFQLTYPGAAPVTITRGLGGNYNAAGISAAVQQLTGLPAEVSGYDGEPGPGTAGFTLDFTTVGSGTDLETFGVSDGSAGVTGFVGTTYNGGSGTNQGAAAAAGNHAPDVAAPADLTIPVRTPFTLTATGTDTDGDALTYLWEQNDQGPTSPNGGTALMSNTKTNGPLFRVFGSAAQVTPEGTLESPSPGLNHADGSPSRTFPDLAQVLAGNTNAATGACPAPPPPPAAGQPDPVPQATIDCYSEFLPTADYGDPLLGGRLNFRVTARDRSVTGGGTAFDDVTLTLDDSAGPFLVTSRTTRGTAAASGATETVTWSVNGTDATGLAPQVRISLSTDGGFSFPHVLATSTANDGSEALTLPDVGTERARLRIEAVGNYFFAVNGADFTIRSPLSLSEVAAQTLQYSDDFGAPVRLTATSRDVDGDQLTATVAGVAGLSVSRVSASADGVRPGTAVFAVSGPVTQAPGAHEAVVTVRETGGLTSQESFAVTVRQEDASVDWTGPTTVGTSGHTASVPLRTSVTDDADRDRGDVTTATVRFVDRDTGALLCTAPVTGGPLTGSAGCDARLALTGNATTYTVGTVVGGSYRRDSAADDTEVTVEAREPDHEAPGTRITSGPGQNSFVLARKVRFRYAGSADTTSFRCELDGKRVACGDGSVKLRRLSTRTHLFTVAARDAAGNLDPTPARRVFVSPYNDGQLDRKGDWDRKRARSAYRGTWLRSTDHGATLTRRLSGVRRIALVVGTRPGFGRVAVFFRGRKVDTVSLAGQRRGKVLVPVAKFRRERSGFVRIEVRGGGPVRIEGLGAR